LLLQAKDGSAQLLTDGTARFPLATAKEAPSFTLGAQRTDDSAERSADPADATHQVYEALTVSWFTSAGKIDGGRSAFDPPGCASQASCAHAAPVVSASTTWEAPTADAVGASGTVRYWAVIRDDRGGVDWLAGTARPQ
jgi:hypothetical protein